METIGILKNVGAMTVRQVTNPRTNEQEDFKAVGVSFTVGSDSLYGEAVQKDAEDICNMQAGGDQRGKLCWFDLRLSEKAFKTKEGKDVTRTEVRGRKILPCW